MENPRSQNYEHELRAELKGNPLAWFVNGMVKEQIAGGGGVTTVYLDVAFVPVKNPFEAEKAGY